MAIGLAAFIAANLSVALAYAMLWPYLYEWDLIDWGSDARFWIELLFHGVLAAPIGLIFCIWFARQIQNSR